MASVTTIPLDPGRTERRWRALFAVGGVIAFLTLAGTLFDIVLSMIPGWSTGSVPTGATAWLSQFAANPALGMRNLDFLNITMSLVGLPMYLALLGVHRRREPGLSLLGVLFVSVGTVVFVSNNAALPMLELSRTYAATTVAGERLAIEAAATALLARGAHGSFGAFLGFFLSEVGTLLMAVAMLRGGLFGRKSAWAGIIGVIVLTVYSVAITFAPGSATLVMAIALPGGLLMMWWNVAVGRGLLRLSRDESIEI